MAGQDQVIGIPGPIHFWQKTTTAYAKIAILYGRGPSYIQEDVGWHTWAEICDLYFPKIATHPNGPRWSIDRVAYRDFMPNVSHTKPDLIAIKLLPAPQPFNLIPHIPPRDYAWIECKPAAEDSPSGWKNVLLEAKGRLEIGHPNRSVYLVIAIGWKCLFFLWDPFANQRPQHFLRSSNSGENWMVDARIFCVLNGPWLDQNTGQIIPEHAITLDSFSEEIVNGAVVLRNRFNLGLIEQFLNSFPQAPPTTTVEPYDSQYEGKSVVTSSDEDGDSE
ncbi:MAG: hypothetical protein M1839_007174 [Geoglossum umbratile]|nr:MAG: hypothetical protein M1839_007174 [Geoglossum umbratile]